MLAPLGVKRCRVLYAIWPADRDITYAIFVERWMLAVIASLFILYVNVAAWFLVGLFIVFGTRTSTNCSTTLRRTAPSASSSAAL